MLGVSRRKIKRLLLFIVLAAFLTFSPALAQDDQPIPDDAVNEVAEGMFCPVCENVPLDVCGTQACIQWRELIREKLAAGETETEIKAYFVEQYGDRVLAEPPPTGFNWLVYIIPPVIVLGALILVIRSLQSWKKTTPVSIPSEKPEIAADDYMQRLEEELQKRK